MMEKQLHSFDQFHIDVARNSSDDFNPFHDAHRWQEIQGNSCRSPIALAFQMGFLAADRVNRRRTEHDRPGRTESAESHFSNYDFSFAGALHRGELFSVDVEASKERPTSPAGVSTRVVLQKVNGQAVLIGSVSETTDPCFLKNIDLKGLPSLQHLGDRMPVPGMPFFMKRKFLNTSNGKNFALASLCDPYDYFDEPTERVYFPPLFTASLISSALLERERASRCEVANVPLVYTNHQISVDNDVQASLRSNDVLHILVSDPAVFSAKEGNDAGASTGVVYRCLGLVRGHQILFRANVKLAQLHEPPGRNKPE